VLPFILLENHDDLIELFNYTDIVRGDSVIWDRLEWFYEEIRNWILPIDQPGLESIDKKIATYYKIEK